MTSRSTGRFLNRLPILCAVRPALSATSRVPPGPWPWGCSVTAWGRIRSIIGPVPRDFSSGRVRLVVYWLARNIPNTLRITVQHSIDAGFEVHFGAFSAQLVPTTRDLNRSRKFGDTRLGKVNATVAARDQGGGRNLDVVIGFDPAKRLGAGFSLGEVGGQDVGPKPLVAAHRHGLSAGNQVFAVGVVLQAVARRNMVGLGHQPWFAGHQKDSIFDVVDALLAVDGLGRRDDAHVVVGIQPVDSTAAGCGFFVIGRQHSGVHRHIALFGAGVAAGDVGSGLLLPFESLIGQDLQRLCPIFHSTDRDLGPSPAVSKRQTPMPRGSQAASAPGAANGGARQ